ncbi:MAG: M6 family metalloprotease domain-containing protein [Bacteroidales bacterium]|nr:M6 family metalloprotease domain-containing protein [Bacteroidales bacterium]
MRKILILLIAMALGVAWLPVFAIPAYLGKIVYTQPDGSKIEIRLHGDEFGRWATDMQGNILSQDAKGFWRVDFGADVQTIRRRAAARRAAANANVGWGIPAFGQKHFLMVLVAFADLPFTVEDANKAISRMMNEPGYSDYGAVGSARDYYYENSHGRFEPIFDIYGPVTLSGDMAYYGHNVNNNDAHPAEAVAEACELLDDEIDFSQYDQDGDGEVDMVFMLYAGQGEADTGIADTIWPHMWYLSAGGIILELDGKKMNRYACSSELDPVKQQAGIGAPCHEFGHTLGLPDLYDTNYTDNGLTAGMSYFSLMDSGSYNGDSWVPPYFTLQERIVLGWVDERALEEITGPGDYVLASVQEEKACKTSTDLEGEYFVYECRTNSGWDRGLEAHGMLVYHVDKSDENVVPTPYGDYMAAQIWTEFTPFMQFLNTSSEHPCWILVPAPDPENVAYGYDSWGYFDWECARDLSFPGAKKVTTYTARSWNGVASEMNLQDINYTGDNVTFTVNYVPHVPALDFFSIKDPGRGKYAAGSSFALELNTPAGQSYDSVQWYFDGAAVSGNAVALSAAGMHLVEAELSLPGGGRQKTSVEIQVK